MNDNPPTLEEVLSEDISVNVPGNTPRDNLLNELSSTFKLAYERADIARVKEKLTALLEGINNHLYY